MSEHTDQPTFLTLFRRVVETLLIAFAGAFALGLAGFPAGWLSGAIVAVSAAALYGRPMFLPGMLARITYVAMGISIGGTVTPETLDGMATWPLSLALLALSMALLTIAVTVYLQFVHKWDPGSALLGAFPGGLATVLVLAIENNADVRGVAVVQTVRVVAVAVLLPAAIGLFGLAAAPLPPRASDLGDPGQLAILVGVSTMAAVAAQWVRLPGGLLFGAMLASAVLHGAGIVTITFPWWLTTAAFILLGALTGTRFSNMDARLLRHLAAAAVGALAVGLTVAFACAAAAAWALGLDQGPMMIAYAPGAIDAMMVLAMALNYEPAFVGAHHLARFMLVIATMPWIVALMRRLRRDVPQSGNDDGAKDG